MTRLKLMRITTIPGSLFSLLKHQLKYMNQFYEVHAVSSPGERMADVQKQEEVIIHTVPMTRVISPFKDLKALIQLVKLIKAERPFIVHTHTPKAGTLGMLAAKICRVPIRVHTVAGLPLLEASGFKRKLLNKVEALTYSCATKVYPNSFKLKDIIVEQKFCKEAKLQVIGNGSSNGIDTTHFNPEAISEETKQALRERIGIKDTDLVYCFIGRMVRDKGVEELVKAFLMNFESNKNIKLILVGPFEKNLDPLDEEIENIIFNHPNIYFADFQKDVRPFFAITDVFVFPSYREGFPNVIMQAGAMGVPCIVSNINGCNEIIEHGINGLIIPVKNTQATADAMSLLAEDKTYRQRIAAVARTMIISRYEQKFIWEQLKKEYQSQIEKAR
ncbi:MAG: glycosyltransferase family 4 protein [Agriterribacter sp.]